MPALKNENCILSPFPGRCIVLRDKAPESFGLIYIPNTARQYPTIGVVVAVGDTEWEHLMGKKVLFPHLSGLDISLKGQPFYTCFSYTELLAVIDVPDGEAVEFEERDDSIEAAPLR